MEPETARSAEDMVEDQGLHSEGPEQDRTIRAAGEEAERRRTRDRHLLASVVTSFIARGLTTLVGLVSLPLAFGYLGKPLYGLWAAVSSLVVWGSLFDLGVSRGLVNAMSEAHGRDDREMARQYLTTAVAGLSLLACALGVIAAIAVPSIDWRGLLGAHGVSPSLVRESVAASVATFVIGLPLGVVQNVYAAYQKLYVANIFAMVSSLSTLCGLVVAIRLHATLPVLILVLGMTGQAVAAFNLLWATRRSLPWLRIRLSAITKAAARRLWSSALPLFLFQIGALLVNETQLIILSRRTNLAVVADYAVLMRLYGAIAAFIALSSAAFSPTFREAFERRDVPWLRKTFNRLVYFRLTLAISACILLLGLGNKILEAWLRQHSVSFSLSVWMAVAVLMPTAVWVTAFSDLLTSLDRIWPQVWLVLLNGTVTAILTFFLAPRLHVLGALIASTIVSLLFFSWLLPMMSRPYLRLKTSVAA